MKNSEFLTLKKDVETWPEKLAELLLMLMGNASVLASNSATTTLQKSGPIDRTTLAKKQQLSTLIERQMEALGFQNAFR
jgi:hypothetical protein